VLGCDPADPYNLGIDDVQGSYCPKDKPDEVEWTGETWLVTIYYNDSTVRDVRDDDGVVHQVEFRACLSTRCNMDGSLSAEEAIAGCRDATNLPVPSVAAS
jgi:hypothetical protein